MHIKDNFLCPTELSLLQSACTKVEYAYKVSPYEEFDFISRKILNYAKEFYNFSNVECIEMWTNVNNVTPILHTDHDMKYFMETQTERYPVCTVVFYPLIDLEGQGWLEVQDQIVRPATNRIVCFGPAIPHIVRPFTGKRVSIVYNPWTHNLI